MPLERGARHGAAGGGERQQRLAETEALGQQSGELVLVDVASGHGVFGIGAEADEVILPGGELAGRVDGAFERVEAADAVEVVPHVVFARPLELHRRADVPGDERGFADHVVDQPPPEPSAGARLVDRHAVREDAEQVRQHRQRSVRRLRGRPDFDPAVLVVGGGVLRLHRRMCDERIAVEAFHRLCRLRERPIGISTVVDGGRRGLTRNLRRARHAPLPAVLRRLGFVPADAQLLPRAERGPGGACHDRDPGHDLGDVAVALDHEGVLHAGQRLHFLQIRLGHLSAHCWALLENCVKHPRHDLVDSEERLASDQRAIVHTADAGAEQHVVLSVLELEAALGGNGQGGRSVGELAVAELALGRSVQHAALLGPALGLGHTPLLGGGRHQHASRRRAGPAQLIPGGGNRARPPRALTPVYGRVDPRLLHAHARPVGIELFGDDHRERRLDTLSDLRTLRVDQDRSVRADAQERIGREFVGGLRALAGAAGRRAGLQREGEHQAPAGHSGELQERSTIDMGEPERLRGALLRRQNQLSELAVSTNVGLAQGAHAFFSPRSSAAAIRTALRMRT